MQNQTKRMPYPSGSLPSKMRFLKVAYVKQGKGELQFGKKNKKSNTNFGLNTRLSYYSVWKKKQCCRSIALT